MEDGIKFFIGQTIEEIEAKVSRFLLNNTHTIEIKSFTEIHKHYYESRYCFCLVYTKHSMLDVQRMGVNGEWM